MASTEPIIPPLVESIVDTIGRTPMVELKRLKEALQLDGRLLAKCEHMNPGFSKKDRIALELMREAKKSGHLSPGQTVVELTSGNTGTGLAMACKAMGHPFVAVISKGNTFERARMMQALGAEVIRVDQASSSTPNQVSGEDLALVERTAQRIVEKRKAYRADQFQLKGNVLAHERYTGPEIWQQSLGEVDAFVDFIGTGGTFTGVMSYLRQKKSDVAGYPLEPKGAPALAGGPVLSPSHRIQGGGYSMTKLPLLDVELVTDYLSVSDEDAINCSQALAREEGIFGGFSSGANLAGAIQVMKRLPGSTIVFIVCDSGLKYISTDLYPWSETSDV